MTNSGVSRHIRHTQGSEQVVLRLQVVLGVKQRSVQSSLLPLVNHMFLQGSLCCGIRVQSCQFAGQVLLPVLFLLCV